MGCFGKFTISLAKTEGLANPNLFPWVGFWRCRAWARWARDSFEAKGHQTRFWVKGEDSWEEVGDGRR